MEYQKSGIVFYKKNNGRYYFLLAKNNLNILNNNNNFYSDIGGIKQKTDFNSRDTAARSFYENTFGLSYPINELVKKISKSYENRKYKHILHFVEDDFSNELISNINSVRSYLNQTIINSENDFLKKKECTLQGCLVSNGVKWFELSEIISNPDNFDKKFMNTFLKSIKNIFMKNKKSSENKVSDIKENTSKIEESNEVSKQNTYYSQNPVRQIVESNYHNQNPIRQIVESNYHNQNPVRQIAEKNNTENLSEKRHSQFYPVNK